MGKIEEHAEERADRAEARSKRDKARAKEGRQISFTLLFITGIVLAMVITGVVSYVHVTRRIEEQAMANRAILSAIARQSIERRCSQDSAHRQVELLIVEIVRRAGGDVKDLELVELPPYCTQSGDVRVDDRNRIIDRSGRPIQPQPDGNNTGTPPPTSTPSKKPPSPTPTCTPIPGTDICLLLP